MILHYKIGYESSDGLVVNAMYKALEGSVVQGFWKKEEDRIELFLVGEIDQIERFASRFSKVLPSSIFLKGIDAEVVDVLPDGLSNSMLPKSVDRPFCPQCFEKIQKQKSLLFGCELCGYKEIIAQSFDVVGKASQALRAGKSVRVTSSYGTYTLMLPSEQWNWIDFEILFRDLASVERYCIATSEELVALAAVEKPTLLLRKSFTMRKEFPSIEDEIFYVRLVDDPLFYHLFEELGCGMLFMTKESVADVDLSQDGAREIEPLKINVGTRSILLLQGERGLPEVERGVFYDLEDFHKIAARNGIEGEFSLCYLSKDEPTSILIYSAKYGWRRVLKIAFDIPDISSLFERIAADETGARLLENYQRRFPEHFERLRQVRFDAPCRSVYDLWGVVALILGVSKSEDLKKAATAFEYKTLEFLGNKGPRIDYKLVKESDGIVLDPTWVIRTAMSFQLAGVEESCLCYGVLESFCDFLATEIMKLEQELSIDRFVCIGSLLENKRLFRLLEGSIGKNYRFYTLKERTLY